MGNVQSLFAASGFSTGHGYRDTTIPAVKLYRADHHEASCPLLYDRGLIFILQGHKLGEVAGQPLRTDDSRYLILCNTRAICCETVATSEEPVLGLHVGLDVLELQRLLQILHEEPDWNHRPDPRSVTRSVVPSMFDENVKQALSELIDVLHHPGDSRALGSTCLTRLYYAVLKSEEGHVLESLVSADSKLSRISAAIRYMETHLDQKITMEDVARIASMSLSSFHRTFREIIGETPLQYLKQLRLNMARNLIAFSGKPASHAAQSVGYESANQFSREFKRYFGVPPSQAKELPYSGLQGIGSNGGQGE